jgi:2,4-dienoyl-CoA reductase-like NADH-dependent reductase (Old Yellow Enzyme family)
MEGWDGQREGAPSELTLRRWRRFGESGAKLIWGGEAVAVRHDGRANPNQLTAEPHNRSGLESLLLALRVAHRQHFDRDDDLLVGLQLTHSGRFSRPKGPMLEPRVAYPHPLLDAKFGIDASAARLIWTDAELEQLVDRYVEAAKMAHDVGFQFVDIKACHGYLIHELLGGHARPGRFGGDFAGRTRFLLTIVERVHREAPDLLIGVRLSVFDTPPYEHDGDVGRPMPFAHLLPYRYGFGLNPLAPLEADLGEPLQLLRELRNRGACLFNVSCGSPYYNPHLQRPAAFPPSDGYAPPEDPLLGVWRQIEATRQIKAALPDALVVGSGYSYLQDFLPHVAQSVVRAGWVDCVGLGRMVLAYPRLPADCLAGRALNRRQFCRTFSDCTTAPRNGFPSGCYPLDPYYKERPEARQLRDLKRSR